MPIPPPIDPRRTAVLVIDMQRDFLAPGAPVATPGGLDLIPRINRLTARARGLGMPVIFTQEMHRADKSDFGIELEFEPPHCLEGTPGMELAETSACRRSPSDLSLPVGDCSQPSYYDLVFGIPPHCG